MYNYVVREGQALYDSAPLERVMYFRASTYCVRSVVVIPAYAGIQAVPRIWIPACAVMTFHLYIHTPGRACNMHNTL